MAFQEATTYIAPDTEAGWTTLDCIAYLSGDWPTVKPPASVDPALRDFVAALGWVLPDDERQRLWPYLPRFVGTANDGEADARAKRMREWALELSDGRDPDPIDAVTFAEDKSRVWPALDSLLDDLLP